MKRSLADVLWEAANTWLGESGLYSSRALDQIYSCNAVELALDREGWMTAFRKYPDVSRFISALGCPVMSNAMFQNFEKGEERQGARYMWLLLAMHVAEDEGLTI